MSFTEYLNRRWDHLLGLAIDHVEITVIAVAISTVIGVTIGALTYDRPRLSQAAMSLTSVFLTIPSLALFGIFISVFGLGTLPVVVALVMYSLLPVIANTVVGLREVDPAVVESARGMGLNSLQIMLRIRLPLARPVIIAGLRVATLLTLGIAALGAYIQGPGLGNEIFAGMSRISSPNALNLVLGGTLGVVVLAILFDLAYGLLNWLTTSPGVR